MSVKPGDLAIVIGAYYSPEAIGRIVEVVRWAIPGKDYRPTGNGDAWICRSDRPLPRTKDCGRVRLVPKHEAPFAACHLRPISGVPVNDEVTDEIREPA